jgi:hypothetical protein
MRVPSGKDTHFTSFMGFHEFERSRAGSFNALHCTALACISSTATLPSSDAFQVFKKGYGKGHN